VENSGSIGAHCAVGFHFSEFYLFQSRKRLLPLFTMGHGQIYHKFCFHNLVEDKGLKREGDYFPSQRKISEVSKLIYDFILMWC
jgi:hypothetical protein